MPNLRGSDIMNSEQRQRYSRHLILPEVGQAGQNKLLQARVLIVGMGGLGCPAALYLTAAGVGQIGLLDFDTVECSNLQRQVLYTTADQGRPKVEAATQRLSALNPDVQLIPLDQRLTAQNALELFSQYDLVIDGTDNFPTRYLVNDACVLAKKVNVYGSILRFEGQISVLAHAKGPCYRCLFPIPPRPGEVPNCAQAGVLGVLPGLIGTAQAVEAIKLILGVGTPLIGRLQVLDALGMHWQTLQIKRNPNCPVCGTRPTITSVTEIPFACTPSSDIESASPRQVADYLHSAPEDYVLLDVRTESETCVYALAGAVNIPLGQLDARLAEVRVWEDKTIVVYCQGGMRSLKAAALLKENGIERIINLAGGVMQWQREVDPS